MTLSPPHYSPQQLDLRITPRFETAEWLGVGQKKVWLNPQQGTAGALSKTAQGSIPDV
jgi:hypothetical protein